LKRQKDQYMDDGQGKENHTDRAGQLSLFSPEELAELQRPSGSHFPREGEMRSSDTTGARNSRRTKGSAIQDKLPGF
jgi:hypothetical protein